MRRIRIEANVNNEPSLLEQLGLDYKAFKKLNPERTARIPIEMKQQAKAVLDGGAKLQTIAETVGLSAPSIMRWLETLEKKSNQVKATRRSKSLAMETPVAVAETQVSPAAPKDVPLKAELREWVKIRIGGREIEIAKADFWEVIQGVSPV